MAKEINYEKEISALFEKRNKVTEELERMFRNAIRDSLIEYGIVDDDDEPAMPTEKYIDLGYQLIDDEEAYQVRYNMNTGDIYVYNDEYDGRRELYELSLDGLHDLYLYTRP